MKATIWKYSIAFDTPFFIDMPIGAKVLSVQTQYNDPVMWALVDPDVDMKRRHFRIFGTGHTVHSDHEMTYIGTFQLLGGSFVGHLFEILKP